jgi:short-subunit dehydrogenase
MDGTENYALVTGASSGIGWHISAALAGQGYPIIAVSNQPAELGELKKQLEQSTGVNVVTLDADLSREGSARLVYEFCEENSLKVEVLVNCAGFLIYGETAKVDPERLESILRLHMTTPALLCRLFGAGMIGRGKGFILNVSSIAAVMPYPTISLYGPTKAFLRNFSLALHTELKPLGVRVTCLLPGATDTGLYEGSNFSISKVKRLGFVKKPEKVAAAGIKALIRNRAECIPGLLNRLVVVLFPLLPRFVISMIYRRIRLTRNKVPGKGRENIPGADRTIKKTGL